MSDDKEKDGKFEIPTKGGRPLTEKDFDSDLPAQPNSGAYSDSFKRWEDELVEKNKPSSEPEKQDG